MKKLLCGLLCLLMLLGCASAEGYLYSAKGDNGLWGHIDETGNWVIPPQFDETSIFFAEEDYAWIQQGDKQGFVSRTGEIRLLEDTEDPLVDYFSNVWIVMEYYGAESEIDQRAGFFDPTSGVYSGLQWALVREWASDSRLIAVANDDYYAQWGYASRDTGELVIPYRYGAYDRGANFCEGYAAVYTEDENYVIQECYLLNEAGEETPLPDGMQFANIYEDRKSVV